VIVPMLQERGAVLKAYDPVGKEQASPLLPGVTWCDSVLEAAQDADLAVVLTEWNEFRAVSLRAMKEKMRGDILVDLRNIYRPELAKEAGLNYFSLGRPGKKANGESGHGSFLAADFGYDSAAEMLGIPATTSS